MDWTDLEFFKHADKVVAAHLAEDINTGTRICPPVHQIMRAFDITKFEDVKVVIVGQDPYPTPGHANGLAFSVNACVQPIPKSLKNIYKELEDDIGIKRTGGSLRDWADQGVFLMNKTLTVREGDAASHEGYGWHHLTNEAISTLSDKHENLVFILWGKKAQLSAGLIDQTKHLTIQSPHPSPLSAYRGFYGSKPFSRTNDYLYKNNKVVIDWR